MSDVANQQAGQQAGHGVASIGLEIAKSKRRGKRGVNGSVIGAVPKAAKRPLPGNCQSGRVAPQCAISVARGPGLDPLGRHVQLRQDGGR